MAPSGRIIAASKTIEQRIAVRGGHDELGKTRGISPSTGTVLKARLATVPVMSAARGPGKYRPHFAGHRNTIASVNRPIPKASQLGSDTAFGTSINAGMVPLPAGSWPNSLAS